MDNHIHIDIPADENQTGSYGRVDPEFLKSLYKAALSGDWKAAQAAYNKFKPSSYCLALTKRRDSALHIAAANKQTEFVRNLVRRLHEKELESVNSDGETALHVAAASGAVEIAKIMLGRNRQLPSIPNRRGKTPLEVAAAFREKKMFEYLYNYPSTSLQDLDAEECLKILIAAIQLDMFGTASGILEDYASIFSSTENKMRALEALAQKPLSRYITTQAQISECLVHTMATLLPFIPCFKRMYKSFVMRKQAAGLVERLWEEIQKSPDGEFLESIRATFIFHDAVKTGNVEFLSLVTHSHDPDLLSIRDSDNLSILHVAIINRQEKIFGLLRGIRVVKDFLIHQLDHERNNVLHLAAKLPPGRTLNSMVPGAALQMQRELLWFQEVKKIVPLTFLEKKNMDNETPEETFIREHEKLQKDGEKWMKDTASSCMVVATLITTVAFAAAFTVPGGNNQDTGIPILLKGVPFTIFVISDALGMFSSTTSIMMFLSILTSRYTDEDFLYSLPKRLVFGLLSLFASIVCLVLAFTAAFFLVYKEEKQAMLPKLVASLACFPITFYVVLNFKLWTEIIRSAWAPRFMFKRRKQKLHY